MAEFCIGAVAATVFWAVVAYLAFLKFVNGMNGPRF